MTDDIIDFLSARFDRREKSMKVRVLAFYENALRNRLIAENHTLEDVERIVADNRPFAAAQIHEKFIEIRRELETGDLAAEIPDATTHAVNLGAVTEAVSDVLLQEAIVLAVAARGMKNVAAILRACAEKLEGAQSDGA